MATTEYKNRSLARRSADTGFAHLLGIASLAIGLTEILAPRKVEQMLGLNGQQSGKDRQGAIRALGVREVCHGLSILSGGVTLSSLRTSVWARVLGDGLDSALLAAVAPKTRDPAKFAVTSAMVMAIGAMDLYCARNLSKDVHDSED